MEHESVEVQAVRGCIANVVRGHEAHTLMVAQWDALVEELNQSTTERATVQSWIAAREKEIALAGGELPDEPFPEEAELSRLSRHIRIRQERVRACEAQLQESQAGLDRLIGELEESWRALGAAISLRLVNDFREAALALRTAQVSYFSLWRRFLGEWSGAAWRHFDGGLAVADPKTAELLLDPRRMQIAEKWPAGVQNLLKDADGLRAEIEAVKIRSEYPVKSK